MTMWRGRSAATGLCRLLAALFISGLMSAQEQSAAPVPTWRDRDQPSAEHNGHYVFLAADEHSIIVLAPADPQQGLAGPKKLIRVPLRNDLEPEVSAAVSRSADDKFIYTYVIGNRSTAKDAIGKFSLIIPAVPVDLEVTAPISNGRRTWGGAPAHAVIAEQPLFPADSRGRYFSWFHQDEHVIHPGTGRITFGLKSSFRPGLTTAWFSSGELLDLDQDWPQEIFQQLGFVEDRRWTDKYVITVGPMFAPDMPTNEIVERLLTEISDLQRKNILGLSSRFVQEVTASLNQLKRSPNNRRTDMSLHSRPRTALEEAIATVLNFSIDIALPK